MLERILAVKRREVDALLGDEAKLRASALEAPAPRDFAAALRRGSGPVRAIAEVKRASPSAGPIRPGADAAAIAAEYQAAGAAAISVLTDGEFFGGSLADLTAVRARVDLPVLRKDFLIDPVQVLQARAAGADAVLLIVAALTDALLRDLMEVVAEQEMTALVEVHDAAEAVRAVAAGATVIGVNHRNLKTLQMDLGLFAQVRPLLGPAVKVAESGIRSLLDVRALGDAGADAVLIGESLMRHPSPGAALAELLS